MNTKNKQQIAHKIKTGEYYMKRKNVIAIPLILATSLTSYNVNAGWLKDRVKDVRGAVVKVVKAVPVIVAAPVKIVEATVKGKSIKNEVVVATKAVVDVVEGSYHYMKDATGVVVGAGYKASQEVINVINEVGDGATEELCTSVGYEKNVNCNIGVSVNSDQLDYPNPLLINNDFSWNNNVEAEAWENKALDGDKFVIGLVFLNPVDKTYSNVTWFTKLPSTPTQSGVVRKDSAGVATVGARRCNSKTSACKLHRGTDYTTVPGDTIIAPFNGKVVNVRQMSNKPFTFVEIENSKGVTARIFYVDTKLTIGDTVVKGMKIAQAADIHIKGGYSGKVTNHIHVEYRTKEGYSLEPKNVYAIAPKKDVSNLVELCKDKQCFSPDNS